MSGEGGTLLGDEVTLLDVVDGLLEEGVSVSGDATISVAGVDLVYLGLGLVLSAVETLERDGRLAPRPGRPASPRLARPVQSSPAFGPGAASARELEAARRELEQVRARLPERIDVDPQSAERGLAKLVLTIVELIRRLLERQAIRRMEGGSLSDEEVERVGLALMRLETKVREFARLFGLDPRELTLGLGPVGRLL